MNVPRALGVDAGLILDTAHEAFVAMGVDGRILEWNRAAESLFGWRRAEVVERELADVIVPGRLREAHRAGLARFNTTGEGPVLGNRLELPALHRDGHEFDVEITISAMTAETGRFFHAFLHDITERTNRDRLLTAQLQVTEILATVEPDDVARRVLEVLCRTGNWDYGGWWLAGDHAEVLHGYSTWWGDDANLEQFESASRAAGFHRGRGMVGLVWQTGEPHWHWDIQGSPDFVRHAIARRVGLKSGLAVPLRAGGEVVGVLEFFGAAEHEPSERQRALLRTVAPQIGEYAARRRAEQRSAQDKDAFVAMVSHELRTPLTAINGFARTAIDHADSLGPERVTEFMDVILQQGVRLSRLVDDLLTTSAIQARGVTAELTEVDLEEAAQETLDELGRAEDFEVIARGGDAVAVADRDLCKQVLVNFASNAIRYGGAPFTIELSSDAEHVVLAVCDEGRGVPADFEPILFDRFTRAQSVSESPGTGLGLSIVRAIAEAQGGRVWYEPNDPRGARFCLELRRAAAAQALGDAG